MKHIGELFSLKGKRAIVTGGARGLGYAMAEALHNADAELVLIATNENNLKKAQNELGRYGAKVSYVVGNLANLDSIN